LQGMHKSVLPDLCNCTSTNSTISTLSPITRLSLPSGMLTISNFPQTKRNPNQHRRLISMSPMVAFPLTSFFFFESNYSASKHEASYCTLLAKVYCWAPCGLTPGPWMCECPNQPGRKVPWWSASFPPRILDTPS